jgi:hypothetical protein
MCQVFLTDMRRQTISVWFDMGGNSLYGLKDLFKISLGALKQKNLE